ncbi:sensor histidine kinase KdpD [Streptomyces sp. TLI_171]|uniref:sensor histidine kinase n=1 Tax=Streptomyces sp. TLI_171 TaxID=1938859 RepID=UPI000C4E9767|nr:ATP-binding protein [Streptomyces sp. TLI_171]RKE20532.1 signal transduction histidine kinase [Streptomyces sp. TLI_171]
MTTTQWCLAAAALLALLAVAAAARSRAVTRTLRGRLAAAEGQLADARVRLTTELADRKAGAESAQREQEINAATRRAFLSVARRILVMAHDQQAGLDEMERTHDDPMLLEGLLRADHAAAQQARLAQTLAVLCGSRAGRHWPEPVALEDVVRGAQGRILPFQRVVVHSRVETAVLGAVAEALIHAVAELLDNATRYSPPSSQVYVTLMPVHNGAVIEIDDCGVGMTEVTVAKAAEALAGGGSLEVSRIGEVPQLGLAAVGRLADQYGFRVTIHSAPSPYGGVRVVVLLPSALLTDPLTVSGPAAVAAARAEAAAPPPARPTFPTGGAAHTVPAQNGGLPRRVNRRDRAPQEPFRAVEPSVPPRSAREAQAFMSLFQSGTADGRSAAQQDRRSAADRHDEFPASPQLPQRSGDSHDHQP